MKKKESLLCVYCALSVLCVGSLAFYIGIVVGRQTVTVVIEPVAEETIEVSTRVLVSSRGKKYYPWWCEAGTSISEKNRRWFSTPEYAERAGYTLAKSCM